jgi:uridine kinase
MSACMSEPGAALAEAVRAAPPRAGETRVLAIDGRSGSGKSTLAGAVSKTLGARCIPLEQLYGGWDGLREGIARLVAEVLLPLARGEPAQVPCYDWPAARWLTPEPLSPPSFLVGEGVGAGALAAASFLSVLAWVDLPDESRHERAMARDGALYEGHWEMWSRQEEEYLRSDRPAQRADLIVARDTP